MIFSWELSIEGWELRINFQTKYWNPDQINPRILLNNINKIKTFSSIHHENAIHLIDNNSGINIQILAAK